MDPGTRVASRYLVEGSLGRGGLATTLRVRDLAGGSELALKLVTDANAHDVLRREFFALRSCSHPRITRVHDFGYWRDGGTVRAFYTSTLVDGVDLAAFAAERTWSSVEAPIGDALSGLSSLHRRGLLHGDVHPGNVLVDPHGRAVLIDLSCVRRLAEAQAFDVSGTPGFIAPELLRGVIDRRADLYAFGMTLRSLRVTLPDAIARGVARLVAKRPEDRPSSAEEAAAILGVPWSRPPASDLLGGVLVGRADAIAGARAVLDDALAGRPGPRAISISGDDGVGRTRLLEEVKAEAQLRMNAILVRGDRRAAVETLLAMALGERIELTSTTALLGVGERLATRDEPIVLLVDDADELLPSEQERLKVLLRTVAADGKIVVVTSSRRPIAAPPGQLEIVLSPLAASELRAWLRAEIPAVSLDEILRATGGYPKEIGALLTQLDGSEWDSRALARAVTESGTTRGPIDLEALGDEARALLTEVVAAGTLEAPALPALDELIARGLVVRHPDGVRLLRRSDATRIAVALGHEAMRSAHRILAARARRALAVAPDREDLAASLIVHLAAFAPTEAALALADTTGSAVMLRPAADAVIAACGVADRQVVHRSAAIYAEAGEPARALALVAKRLSRRPPHDEGDALRILAGQCYAQMGDSRRAAGVLSRVLPRVVGRPDHARVAAALSLALLKRGADGAAADVVRTTLDGGGTSGEIDRGARLDLHLNAAFATSRLGDVSSARASLALGRDLAADASPRGRFRLASAIAFVEYGAGETPAAVRAYKDALEIAERNGLDDLVASAALNYGSACHELGDLSRALDAYGRGQRLAVALGMPTTEVTLAFDLAKVYADIGSHDRAEREAITARSLARRERMTLIEAGASAVLAEVASARGDQTAASRHLDDAARQVAGASEREVIAVSLLRAKVRLAAGDVAGANRGLDECGATIRTLGMRDVEAAWRGVRGGVAIAEGRSSDAILELESALELADATGQRGLIAELEARLAEAFSSAGSAFLAARHTTRAREHWEKTLASLPAELHDAFRRHPIRAKTFAATAPPRGIENDPEPRLDVRRILEINRRLNSASSTTAVLEETMDAAISLTNAERGFLLVETPDHRGTSSLRLAVARNVDRETIRQGNLKFSRTVAERVVRTGEPVIAVDAEIDPRFTKARSVHAMKLKSLLCVPIRSPDGVLGAIYVDHRFSSGSFRPELADLLLALGDQAALAIVKARLVEELRSKTQELATRNAEVEHLARGQALEIARLKRSLDDVDERAQPAVRRFDYGSMIAASPPMQRVLSVLDRVIDTDVTVLVRGESGTGKERVARAVHANSARANGPFVAINCGALPETLLEAELFGYRRGAFSGATRDQPGVFVSAGGGTLFLDELGEMPPSMQVKLLRVLQEREVRPLGANDTVATDVRLVCATNRVLAEEVRAGRFREDLYYRVAVVDVELPPLRQRIEDILPLAEATLVRLSTELGRPLGRLDRGAERALLAHAWPGNVRELENVLTKAFLLGTGNVLGADDLELGISTPTTRGPSVALRARILATLEETDWNVVVAARALEMPRATLYRKMRRFGIVRPER